MSPAVTPLREERGLEDAAMPIVPLLHLALKILSEKALLWVVTLGAGAAWGFTVLHPDPLRILTAMGYSLTVMVPVLWYRRRQGGD